MSNASQEVLELIDSVDLLSLGPPRGGRRKADIQPVIVYERDLTSQDIDILNSAPTLAPINAPVPQIANLRYTHHTLARLIAQGKSVAEASAITGHTPHRIYVLTSQDEGFKDLVKHYSQVEQQAFADAAQRLSVLGMATVEELQQRLEEKPTQFSNKDLLSMAELAFERTGVVATPGSRSAGSGNGVNISVSFVAAKSQPALEAPQLPVIDVQAVEVGEPGNAESLRRDKG